MDVCLASGYVPAENGEEDQKNEGEKNSGVRCEEETILLKHWNLKEYRRPTQRSLKLED